MVVLGYPGVQALDLVGPFEVFTGATIFLASQGRVDEGYSVSVVSRDGEPATTLTGLALVSQPLPDPREPIDTLVLPGGIGVDQARHNPDTIGWIQIAAEHSRRVVSVCTGSFLAAQAGLVDGCVATTHWAFAGLMAREFPAVTVDPEPIFVRSSEKVWTAAGVTAGIDLALSLVEDDYGTEVAQTVARKDFKTKRMFGEKQALSRMNALRAATAAGAYLTFDEAKKGSLEVGKYADLIVPSDDPLTVAEDKLADMTSKMTMVGGKIVHETPGWSG